MFEFKIDAELPTLNNYVAACKRNRYAGGKMAKTAKFIVSRRILMEVAKRNTKNTRIWDKKVDVKIEWVCKNRMTDPDNISFAKKFILDALQDTGVLKNDGFKNINSFSDTFSCDKSNPYIMVKLVPIG
jgi:hypothetical protein